MAANTHHSGPPVGQGSLSVRRWTFGSAVLDERTLELRVGSELASLERKSLEVLIYLLQHAGEVVTKDELFEKLWPGRILTEGVLTRCISQLRKALRDDDRTQIRTVHKFGYRLVADVQVEHAAAPAPRAFPFGPGDRVPHRPQWRLVERLGTGGYGEAWRVRHEKTGEGRAFKFALDPKALSSLKREVTLFRVLRDTLGEDAPVVRLLEWNFEEPPYFTESEYVAGGNLVDWLESQGGVKNIPLDQRLELVASIAEAVGAIHAVGILHKDLKPSNVLMDSRESSPEASGRLALPKVRLADFGSGGVLDPTRLEELGITRLGFTKSTRADHSGGTAIYIAPEVIAGQPYTTKSDIYALGVLLYQLIVGDLRKPLAPGWEIDVENELLREDILEAAAGAPERRLPDAFQLSSRTRSLQLRKTARIRARNEKLLAHRAEESRTSLRRTRVVAAALFILAGSAIASGVVAIRAKSVAVEAAATSSAISDFLLDDVLWIDPLHDRPQDDSATLLERASSQVDERLVREPQAAAQVHYLLGRRYLERGDFGKAALHFESSTLTFESLFGTDATPTVLSSERLSWSLARLGDLDSALAAAERVENYWQRLQSPSDPHTLLLRTRLAFSASRVAQYKESIVELRSIIDLIPQRYDLTTDEHRAFMELIGLPAHARIDTAGYLRAQASGFLASVLSEFWSEYEEPLVLSTNSLAYFLHQFGDDHIDVAYNRLTLGYSQLMLGRYTEAESNFLKAKASLSKWLRKDHAHRVLADWMLGLLRYETGQYEQSQVQLQSVQTRCDSEVICSPRQQLKLANDLTRVYLAQEYFVVAQLELQKQSELRMSNAPEHKIERLESRILQAETELGLGNIDLAQVLLSTANELLGADLPSDHAARADYHRVQGLVLAKFGNKEAALRSLQKSLKICDAVFGSDHLRTKRTAMEIDRVEGT